MFVAKILLLIVRLLDLTYRYRYSGMENFELAKSMHPQGIHALGLWHCNAVACLFAHKNTNYAPLISKSKDGALIAYAAEKVGLDVIRGSSSRGGIAAQKNIISLIKNSGKWPTYTVDGPRGPRFLTKKGILHICYFAKIPALPVTAVASRYWEFSSWDRFRLPKPFSKIHVIYGPPLEVKVPSDKTNESTGKPDFKAMQLEFDARLRFLEDKASDLHGKKSNIA